MVLQEYPASQAKVCILGVLLTAHCLKVEAKLQRKTHRLKWLKGTSEFLKARPYNGGTWPRTGRGCQGSPCCPGRSGLKWKQKFKDEAVAMLWVQTTRKIIRIIKRCYTLYKKKIK